MSRLFQIAFLMGGISLLLMTAGIALSRVDEPLEWMIYEDEEAVYWLHPDSGIERRMFASPSEPWTLRWRFHNNHFYFLMWTPNRHLFRIDSDGKNLQHLSHDIEQGIGDFGLVNNKFLIAETFEYNGPADILLSTSDTTTISWINLTNTPNQTDLFWTISADNEWLYFTSQLKNELDEWGVFRIRIDGTQRELLVTNPNHSTFIDLSPNGEWLWFVRNNQANNQLYRLSTISGSLEQLSELNVDRIVGWSSNREQLFFTANDGNHEGIYQVEDDGTNLSEVSSNIELRDGIARISPDGSIIIVLSCSNSNCGDIFSINLANGNLDQLTNSNSTERFVQWSPDGKQILYAITSPDAYSFQRQYFIADADGQNTFPLAPMEQSVYFPDWSPDGEWITFTAEIQSSMSALFRIRRDGTNRQQLTHNRKEVTFHTWSPPIDIEWNRVQSFLVGIGMLAGGLSIAIFQRGKRRV